MGNRTGAPSRECTPCKSSEHNITSPPAQPTAGQASTDNKPVPSNKTLTITSLHRRIEMATAEKPETSISVWAAASNDPPFALPRLKQRQRISPPRLIPRLLQLPARAWETILLHMMGNLDKSPKTVDRHSYPDILSLSLACSAFHEVRVERFLPWRIPYAVVLDWERYLLAEKLKFACYLCYRIKRADSFQVAGTQLKKAIVKKRNKFTGARTFAVDTTPGEFPQLRAKMQTTAWKPQAPGEEEGDTESFGRYCIQCAIQCGLLRPGDTFYRMTDDTKELRLCRCGIAWDVTKEECTTCKLEELSG